MSASWVVQVHVCGKAAVARWHATAVGETYHICLWQLAPSWLPAVTTPTYTIQCPALTVTLPTTADQWKKTRCKLGTTGQVG